MLEIDVDPVVIKKALGVVKQLEEVAAKHERIFPAAVDAVFVFSGPGTYVDKLKPGQPEMLAWMDRDRIRAGIAVVREVTASRMREQQLDVDKKGGNVTKEEIYKHGPLFVYNGLPVENEVFREAISSEFSKIPETNVLVIDEVVEEDGTAHPIRHTGDQFKSFFQAIVDPSSPLFGSTNIALVAHIPDFVRHPFYAEKYNEELRKATGRSLSFWAYGLRSRKGSREKHMESELVRLVEYAKKGDLATIPAPLNM